MSGKKYKLVAEKIESGRTYSLNEGLNLVVSNSVAKFDESVDISISLSLDTRKSDQQIRGFISLPNGLGRNVRVLVFAKGDDEEAAQKAGADFTGGEDLVEKIKEGWLDFDRVISTPDMMPVVSKVAKILGPKGLMPNPKLGTVTPKVGLAVTMEKKGKASFRTDKNGIIHSSVGRQSMGTEGIKNNFLTFLGAVIKAEPSSNKGVYLKKIVLSSTMGPGVVIDINDSRAQIT